MAIGWRPTNNPLISACKMSIRFLHQMRDSDDKKYKARCQVKKILFATEAIAHTRMHTESFFMSDTCPHPLHRVGDRQVLRGV